MTVNDGKTGFNTTAVVLLAVAAGIFIWAIVLFLQGGFSAARANEFAAKNYHTRNEQVQEYRNTQRAILEEKVRWLDREQGTVVMPISDAKARIVEKHADR